MSVCFATKCWGGDWQKFLSGAFDRKIEAIGYPFENKFLVFNNGVPGEMAELWKGSWTKSDPVISAGLGARDPNRYASGELAAAWFSQDYDYLCYVQGDAITVGGDWVTPAIAVLESEPDVMVVSPESEVNTWHDADGYDRYMSDWAFVVRVKDFMDPAVYAVPGTDPDYPAYGGNSFEAMVGKYLKASGKKRKILNGFHALHPAY